MPTAWAVDGYEAAAGWGPHDEGCSVHRDEAALERYVAARCARWPDLRATNRRRVEVGAAVWERLGEVDGVALRSPEDAFTSPPRG